MAQTPFRIPGWRDIERLAFEGRISMSELCRRAEVHGTTFRKWKGGRTSPTVATVQALLDAGLAAVTEAKRAERTATPAPRHRPRRPPAKAAAHRPARRRA